MIRILFVEPTSTRWKRWIRECANATADLVRNYNAGKPICVADLYRRKSIKEEVYLSKDGPFRGRCAYCESYIADFQHGDIEHFRPKKGVTDENDVAIKIRTPEGKEISHPGYYWLAYSWSNLLPSCVTCNQPGDGGIGKRNRFPVEGGRYATTQEEVQQEKPLLINPIDPNDDDPEQHFEVDLESGALIEKDGSLRAQMCIRVFGLNFRDQLVKERRGAMEEVKAKCVKLLFADAETAKATRLEIAEIEGGQLNHTFARRVQITTVRERLQ